MENPKFVIGLIGEIGSGKGTFGELLRELSQTPVGHLRFSTPLGDVLTRLDIELNRQNYQNLALGLRQHFGQDVVANALRADLLRAPERILVLDGARYPEDINLVRGLPNHLLVYVTADRSIRFKRVRERKEKTGEGLLSAPQFLALDQAGTEKQIPIIGQDADIKIVNNGTLAEYNEAVTKVWNDCILESLS